MKFATGELGHVLTVSMCGLITFAVVMVGRAAARGGWEPRLSKRLATLGAIFWIGMQFWWMWPTTFKAEVSLPLHICDVLGPIAVLNLAYGFHLTRSINYFWGFAFTTQAFITPVTTAGPWDIRYWLFWVSHTLILGTAVYDLAVRHFRPTILDLKRAVGAILLYFVLIEPLNIVFRWNYGYVGPARPETPTLLDALGPWPLRLLWLFLIMLAIFFLMLLPFVRCRKPTAPVNLHHTES